MGRTPFDDPRYPAGNESLTPAHVPSVPSYDAGSAGVWSRAALRRGTDLRWDLTQDPEYSRPEITSELNRGLRYAANKTPIGVFVDDPEAGSWKTITMEYINNNPEILERWQKLSAQDQAFILMDGSNKLVDLMSAPQEMYDRLMGSSETQKVGDKLVTTRTPGQLTTGRGLAQPAGAPQPGQAGPGPAQAGRRRVAGQAQPPAGASGAGAPQAGQLRRPAGQSYTSNVEDYGPDVAAVVIQEGIPGLPPGSQLMLPPDEFRERVKRGQVQGAGDNPTDLELYQKRNPETGVADGPTRQISNAEFRASKVLQEDYVLVGELKPGIDSAGNRKYVGEGALKTGANVGVERSRNPVAVENVASGEVKWVDESEVLNLKGWRPATTREMQVSEKGIERAVGFKRRIPQAKRILSLVDRMGRGGLAFTGKMGVVFGNMAKLMGNDVVADEISQMMSGGDLSLTELGSLQSFIMSYINQSKEEFINDQRLSEPDQRRMDAIGQIKNVFANQETIKHVFMEFTRFALITSELELEAAGQASQFPVNTEDEFVKTVKELTGFLGDADAAAAWAMSLREYPELN